MNKLNRYIYKIFLLPIFLLSFTSLAFIGGEKGDKKKNTNQPSLIAGDSYLMFINNVEMPLNRTGVLADVQVPGSTSEGKIDGIPFLFSSGFFMSGVTNGNMWANAVATASRIQDYAPGTTQDGRNDPRAQLYVIRQSDGDFAESWDEWKNAVALGAYFYDGDGDGVYNPVDKNGNGKWDPDEDRPDLLGDETVWCVYHDGIAPSQRRYNDVEPQGINIRQTVFGFNSKGVVGNMLFIRYSILNTGTVADLIDSVYFGVWADPDVGDYTDDLVGCDTLMKAGYVYNDGDDAQFGNTPPTFMTVFFQGPVAYIPGVTFVDANSNGVYDAGETALDTAYVVEGQIRGVQSFPGATNLKLSSFVHYMQSHPRLGDPATRVEARNYMLGQDKIGGQLDPCTWSFGSVLGGVNCALVNKDFWYSGNPVTNIGWINNFPTDQRQMSNTGPFQLVKDKPVDIVVAYVVARGTNALNSITKTKEYARTAQLVFDNNFPSPPAPPQIKYSAKSGDGFIEIDWPTWEQVSYRAVDTVLDIDRRFQGFYVSAFRTNAKIPVIEGVVNAKEMANYSKLGPYGDLYDYTKSGGKVLLRHGATGSNLLDSALYSNPATGRLRFRITKDPFTDGPLIKGKEYYFGITNYTLNHVNVKQISPDTTLALNNALEEFETPIIRVVYGDDYGSPAIKPDNASKISGASVADIKYVVVDKAGLKGHNYEIEFVKGAPATSYTPYWRLRNVTTNTVLADSQTVYSDNLADVSGYIYEGIIPKIPPIVAELGTPTYSKPAADRWYKTFSENDGTGVTFIGLDTIIGGNMLYQPGNVFPRSKVVTPGDLRRIELRFDETNTGKAYRYIHDFRRISGYTGQRINNLTYAEGLWPMPDVIAQVGQLDANNRPIGYVDVPFTAWMVDPKFPDAPRQLAVGFIERKNSSTFGKGKPDGIWDPQDSLLASGEVILIFNSTYDPTGKQFELTGGVYTKADGSTDSAYADLLRIPSGTKLLPDTAIVNGQMLTKDQINTFNSTMLNTLYVVGMQRKTASSVWGKDTLVIPVTTYPYSSADRYGFKTITAAELEAQERKALFEKVNVFPNPLFAYNPATSYNRGNPDEPFVTFSNLPEEVTIKIYTLSGTLIRTLSTADKSSPSSIFLKWDLQNDSGLRVASGMYLAVVTAPGFGEKVLKFAVIMPQKQIQRF